MSPTFIPALLAATASALAAALAFAWWRQRLRTREAERRLAEQLKTQANLPSPEEDESLGRLAREVAHEFNNVLAVVSTTTEVLLMELTQPELDCGPERLESSLRHVHAAAQRGAGLSRRLLAAGRSAAPQARGSSDAAWAPGPETRADAPRSDA